MINLGWQKFSWHLLKYMIKITLSCFLMYLLPIQTHPACFISRGIFLFPGTNL